MAILSNLLVNGTSRLLGKLYCSDLDVSSDLSINGKLSIPYTGLYIAGKKAIWSNSATDTWLRINYSNFSSGVYFSGSVVRTDGEFQVGSSGTYFKSNSTETRIANLVSPNGNITTLRSGSGTFDNLNVVNTLRSNRWDIQSVANLGGSFYVAPTLNFTASTASLSVTRSSDELTLTINDDSTLISNNLAGIAWTANSLVKVSGTINNVVSGTMNGRITSVPSGNTHVLSIVVPVGVLKDVFPENKTYSSVTFSDLNVMVYQRKVDNYDYRVGIWMNCYDIDNESATIRIYGGNSDDPNVMIGNLHDAQLQDVNGLEPDGWGLFAQNAFLHGHIVANAGKIGGFTLGTESMYSGDNFPNTNNFYLMPTGSQSATYNIAGSGLLNNWVMTSGTTFGVTKAGAMYSTSGKIGGWNITASSLFNGTSAMNSNTAGLYLGTDGIRNYNSSSKYVNIQNGVITAVGANISGVLSAGANSTIGPWTITDTSIYKTNATWGNATAGAAYFGNNGISITDKFKVSAAGAMTAVSGSVGGWNIEGGEIWSTTSTTNPKTDGATVSIVSDASRVDFISIIKHSSDGNSFPFYVTKYGTLHAEQGTIGGWTINTNGLSTKKSWLSPYSFSITSQNSNDEYYWSMSAYKNSTSGKNCLGFGHKETSDYNPAFTFYSDNSMNIEAYPKSWQEGQSVGAYNVNGIEDNDSVSFFSVLRFYRMNTDGGNFGNTYTLGYYSYDQSYNLLYSPSSVYSSSNGYSAIWKFKPNGEFQSINGQIMCKDFSGNVRYVCCAYESNGSRAAAIGTNASNQLSIHGQFGNTSTYSYRLVATTTSDVRLKKNIEDTKITALPVVNAIKIRQFDWKENNEHKSIGFVADELEKLNPELVFGGGYEKDGTLIAKGIDTLELIAYLTKAIQEQQAEIETLKKQLVSLQQK